MLRALRTLIERQILKARAEGKLSGLAGEGKPLPDRSGEAHVDAGTAAGLHLMAEAGVTPEEFRLKKELDAALEDHATLTDPEARRASMARVAELEMRYNMARDARRAFLR